MKGSVPTRDTIDSFTQNPLSLREKRQLSTCSVFSFTKLVRYKAYSVKRVFQSVKSRRTVLNQGLHHRFVDNAPVANYE